MENSIELIKSRLSKTTPGKWEWVEDEKDDDKLPVILSGDYLVLGFGDSDIYHPAEGTPPDENDAEFIVNAKSDIEFLLKQNERLLSIIMDLTLEREDDEVDEYE